MCYRTIKKSLRASLEYWRGLIQVRQLGFTPLEFLHLCIRLFVRDHHLRWGLCFVSVFSKLMWGFSWIYVDILMIVSIVWGRGILRYLIYLVCLSLLLLALFLVFVFAFVCCLLFFLHYRRSPFTTIFFKYSFLYKCYLYKVRYNLGLARFGQSFGQSCYDFVFNK